MDPRMTLHEMCEAFRANLIPISEPNAAEMICQNKFPFAIGCRSATTGERVFLISRAGCYGWIESFFEIKAWKLKDDQE